MGRSLQRLDSLAKPDSFNDQKTASQVANSEVSSTDLATFGEALLSQIKRIIHGDDAGNWNDDIMTVLSAPASLKALLTYTTQGVIDVSVKCLATDSVGELMHINGDLVGDDWDVTKADCFNESKMPVSGILISKDTSTSGIMRRSGIVNLYAGLDITKHYFVGSAGTLVNPAPIAPPAGYAVVQRIGLPLNASALYLTGEVGPLFKLVN